MRSPARAVGAALALCALAGALVLWRTTNRETPAIAPSGGSVERESAVAVEADALPAPPVETASSARVIVPAATPEPEPVVAESRGEPERPVDEGFDFHGVVVDDATGEPIAGARVDARNDTTTDALGAFQLRGRSSSKAKVEAPGYARRAIRLREGHETPERAFVVPMLRAASIEIVALEANGAPVAGARVAARTDESFLFGGEDGFGLHSERWRGNTGSDGRCLFADVIPRVRIEVEVERDGELPRSLAPFQLEPDDVRVFEVRFGGGARVHGRALDQHGMPVAHVELWLMAEHYSASSSQIFWADKSDIAAQAMTDDQGWFELLRVPPGSWGLGPKPLPARRTPSPEDVASMTTAVEVDPSATSVEVHLRLDRGLFLRGTVLDSTHEPAEDAFIQAFSGSPGRHFFGDFTESDGKGAFLFGPVPAGRYTLTARGPDFEAESLPVEAEAGASDIVLLLRGGARVSGHVVDGATGAPRSAKLFCSRADEYAPLDRAFTSDGTFAFEGLAPGDYSVAAATADGGFAFLSGLSLAPAERRDGLVLATSPGGRLRVTGSIAVDYRVSLRGQPILIGYILDEAVEIPVPADELVVELLFESAPIQSRTVRVGPGETAEVVFGSE